MYNVTDENQKSDTQAVSNFKMKKKVFFTKRKGCVICSSFSKEEVSYKNPGLIQKFISEGGRILPKRVTNICTKHQKKLKKAIKRARVLALLYYVIS